MSKPFEVKSLSQLREAAKANPLEYLVEGLLPAGSINQIAGKPKSGKSTLSRQLATCVAKGAPFLGRQTIKGQTLYFGIEELDSHVIEHFDLLGAEEGTIHTVTGKVGKDAVERLDAVLEDYPDVRLVIIDPLFKFIKTPDADKYMDVSNALEELADVARRRAITILCVHHSKKRETEEVGDSALGSTAIVGGMFTSIFIKGDSARTIQTSQRYGVALEPTALVFDAATRSYTLGASISEVRQSEEENKRRDKARSLIQVILSRPDGIEHAELQLLVGGNTAELGAKLRALVEGGAIRREGAGKRGKPYKYFPPDSIPTESPTATSTNTIQ